MLLKATQNVITCVAYFIFFVYNMGEINIKKWWGSGIMSAKVKILSVFTAITILAVCMTACSSQQVAFTDTQKGATQITKEINKNMYSLLDFTNREEYECAEKGLITAPENLEITDENGKVIWSQKAYSFLDEATADTANPSLWRNTQLNHIYGLFEVTDGIYQVRGYDMSNITFIKGDTGWIVFDPLMTVECSQAAKALVDQQLGEYPVKGVVISHSHVDHYGGIKGVVSEEEVEKNNIPIIAPENFEEHAISENVFAGNAMSRRATYQYGTMLDQSDTGALSIGIGMGQSKGTVSYISPNKTVKETGTKITVDGIEMEFQMTPGTEAPAEMNTWFPDKNALWLAENCTGTLHNLYTLRGAEVRDGNAWASYLMETLSLYGDKAETVFQSHNWPHWGNQKINTYISDTAAAYKFINDQTLMYINQGYTETEIADMIELPKNLAKNWYTRQYYGTVAHNSKAVYQKYMGWYDANPVHLAELTPTESAKKYVEYMGDTNEILKKAKADFDKGEYQWVAEITNVLVYADPNNKDARYLCADALEQLAYQAESGTWRNAYLSGAKELREGTIADENYKAKQSGETKQKMSTELMLNYIDICLDSNAAQDLDFTVNLIISDLNEKYLLTVKSGVLLFQKDKQSDTADVTWTMPKAGLFTVLTKDAEQQSKLIKADGDSTLLKKLCDNIVTFDFFFNIVEP